jgi:hypothetical protein
MIPGPKVMLVNETAGSSGDFLPWLFRKFGLGKLIFLSVPAGGLLKRGPFSYRFSRVEVTRWFPKA